MLNKIVSIILIFLCWIFSMVNVSGWGIDHHTPEIVNFSILILALILFVRKPIHRFSFGQSIWSGKLIVCSLFAFLIIPYIVSEETSSWGYSIAFVLVYVLSHCTINTKVIWITGLGYAVAGIITLIIYVAGELLSGWNDNSMAMIGLFSFLYFSIVLVRIRGTQRFWLWNMITVIYIVLLFSTFSRSGMVFSIIAVFTIYYLNYTIKLLERKRSVLWLLNIPLSIAVLTIWLSGDSWYIDLNDWSLTNYNKPIFNGRDQLWLKGWELLVDSDFLGTGVFLINYHNSAIAALSVFGVFGYCVWIAYFSKTIKFIKFWMKDDIVVGGLIAFFLIFLQQSVELGFISETPNLIPYAILGVTLGRIRTLCMEREEIYG